MLTPVSRSKCLVDPAVVKSEGDACAQLRYDSSPSLLRMVAHCILLYCKVDLYSAGWRKILRCVTSVGVLPGRALLNS